MRLRVPKRFVWRSAVLTVVTVFALAAWAVLAPPVEVERAAHSSAPAPVVVRPRAERPRTSATGSRVAVVASASRDRAAALERRALDRSAPVAKREAALRRLAALDALAARRIAVELVRAREGGSIEREAARVVTGADKSALRDVIELLLRTEDSETALACGAALDAWAPLEATDLSRALSCAALAEARVVLLRALAQASPDEEAQIAIEQCLRCDPSPLVRSEAFAALAPDRLEAVSRVVLADPAARRVAPRVLARVSGAVADELLEESFRVEADPKVLSLLARTLAGRSERTRSALLELAQTPERAAIANAALAALDRTTRARNP